jgi:hypothetical protein
LEPQALSPHWQLGLFRRLHTRPSHQKQRFALDFAWTISVMVAGTVYNPLILPHTSAQPSTLQQNSAKMEYNGGSAKTGFFVLWSWVNSRIQRRKKESRQQLASLWACSTFALEQT